LCDQLEADQKEREQRHFNLARASVSQFTQDPTPANLEFVFHKSYDISPSDLRKTILSLAVQGKLVPQDPDDEPALVTLKSHGVSATQPKNEHVRHARDESSSERTKVLHSLPGDWSWVPTEEVCEAIIDCPHSTPVFAPTGYLCLDTNSFKAGVLLQHKLRFVRRDVFEDRRKRLSPRPGDIVFAREGSVGESIVIPEGVECCLGQRVMLFRLFRGLVPSYFRMALSEESSLSRLLELHKGIGARHVNVGDMRNAMIPLPPLAEQKRIVAKGEELMALVDQLEAQIGRSKQQASLLLDALVADLTKV
jgi:type I restriction enzyme S subunit